MQSSKKLKYAKKYSNQLNTWHKTLNHTHSKFHYAILLYFQRIFPRCAEAPRESNRHNRQDFFEANQNYYPRTSRWSASSPQVLVPKVADFLYATRKPCALALLDDRLGVTSQPYRRPLN